MDQTAIREIQEALRLLSFYDNRLMPVTVDGIYSRQTAKAVQVFQSLYGLDPSGESDSATWQELRDATQERQQATVSINAFPHPAFILRKNDVDITTSFIQVMLTGLSRVYSNIDSVVVNGIYDDVTENEIKKIQQLHRIEPSGDVDLKTWNTLTTLYNNRFDAIKE